MQLDLHGLYTNPNPVGQQVPRGGLRKANDIVVDRPGVGSPRRADDYRTPSGDLPSGIANVFDYAGTMFGWSTAVGEGLHRGTITDTETVWTQVDTLDWSAGSLRYATGGGDLYLTSDSGPLVMDGTTATPAIPGAPPALDAYSAGIQNLGTGTAGVGPLAVAARLVIGYNDSEGRPVLGAPSGRITINTSSAAPTDVFDYLWTFTLPSGLTTANFIQLYRTLSVPAPSEPSTDAGDTMFLVYERPLTSTEVSTRRLDILDVVPDGLAVGTPLYTNPDRGGQGANNVRPPLAGDMTTFRNRLWLANTVGKHRLSIRLISTLNLSTTITIAGDLYQVTTDATDPLTPPEQGYFEAFNGYPSVALNIAATMRSLVDAINRNTANTDVWAFYVSGVYDAPGQIVIEERVNGGSTFTMQTSDGAAFVPNAVAAVPSISTPYPNRLHYSKEGVFYGFPLSNTLQVGAEEFAISRIVALRDTLLVFKENGGDGLWKVTGNGPWYVEQVNAGVHLIAPDTVVVANNTAFALTDKGVIAVSESGSVDTISVPIEDKIRDIILTRAAEVPFARAFVREANTEEKVYFGFPDDTNPLSVAESYVWNIATETWTRDTREWTAAFVGADGRMVRFSEDGESGAFVERNSGNRLADSLGVSYEVEWNTETGDMPDGEKQFSQAAVLFQQAQPLSVDAEMWFTADDGTPGPAVETGGEGFPYIRAEVPFDQQRTTRLGVEIRGTVTTTLADILGMSVTYRTYAPLKGR